MSCGVTVSLSIKIAYHLRVGGVVEHLPPSVELVTAVTLNLIGLNTTGEAETEPLQNLGILKVIVPELANLFVPSVQVKVFQAEPL